MSDNEAIGPAATSADDTSLPKATIAKLVTDLTLGLFFYIHSNHTSEYLSGDLTCGKDVKEFLGDCCKEFILLVSGEANEICEKSSKKTILPEHVVAALKSLGFDSYVEQVDEVASEHKQQSKDNRARKTTNKLAASGLTEEELIRQQEMLFAGSKARYEAAAADPPA